MTGKSLAVAPDYYDGVANDLRARIIPGPIITVELYDADDHEHFWINEDEVGALRDYLNRVIEHYKL